MKNKPKRDKAKTNRRIKDLMKELNLVLENGDNEAIHAIYDEIIEERLKQFDAPFVYRLRRKVKDWSFWYA